MTAASFPRSQASPAPTEFAEIEPTRFCSVGGNGIKFYSNLRLTASVRCDQSAHCSARPWIATSNLELPRAAWKTPRCKSPCLAISFTLTAVCNARSLLADSTQGQKLITCMESSSIHRKSRKTVNLPPSGKQKQHGGQHPQPVSLGNPEHTPKAMPWQEKPLRPQRRKKSVNGKSRPNRVALCTMAVEGLLKLPYWKINPEPGVHLSDASLRGNEFPQSD